MRLGRRELEPAHLLEAEPQAATLGEHLDERRAEIVGVADLGRTGAGRACLPLEQGPRSTRRGSGSRPPGRLRRSRPSASARRPSAGLASGASSGRARPCQTSRRCASAASSPRQTSVRISTAPSRATAPSASSCRPARSRSPSKASSENSRKRASTSWGRARTSSVCALTESARRPASNSCLSVVRRPHGADRTTWSPARQPSRRASSASLVLDDATSGPSRRRPPCRSSGRWPCR